MITKIIIDNLRSHKENTNKKTVLIIEDLDRLDPGHLFRILNIFSAHIDRVYQLSSTENICSESNLLPELLPNKFGFDNIVTVFDYNRTRKVFHHLYGENANFEGYIDKFKSHNIFDYSITEIARRYMYDYILEECKIPKEEFDKIRKISTDSLLPVVSELSIRNIKQILTNIEEQIEAEILNTENYNFSSVCPITKTVAILIRMGYSNSQIFKFITEELEAETLLSCLQHFVFHNNDTFLQRMAIIKMTLFNLSIESNGLVIYRKNRMLSKNGLIGNEHLDITNTLPSYISKVFECVKR